MLQRAHNQYSELYGSFGGGGKHIRKCS
ncbi:hypothetical protein MTBLM5_10172 [Magnetospirillum sp. LM-5]|nr:hypothetical protein MTBLM5_10172 [Magnetospirillum sp. LM-5]